MPFKADGRGSASYNGAGAGCCPSGMSVVENSDGSHSKCCTTGSTFQQCCQPGTSSKWVDVGTGEGVCCSSASVYASNTKDDVRGTAAGCCPSGMVRKSRQDNGYIYSYCCNSGEIAFAGYHNNELKQGCCPVGCQVEEQNIPNVGHYFNCVCNGESTTACKAGETAVGERCCRWSEWGYYACCDQGYEITDSVSTVMCLEGGGVAHKCQSIDNGVCSQ